MGVVIFEGEYLNWKKNGKGNEYYENGKIKFKGEYLNGKKIENFENRKIKFDDEYLYNFQLKGKYYSN